MDINSLNKNVELAKNAVISAIRSRQDATNALRELDKAVAKQQEYFKTKGA